MGWDCDRCYPAGHPPCGAPNCQSRWVEERMRTEAERKAAEGMIDAAKVRKAFEANRGDRLRRGVEWRLTFDQWWRLWESHWHERGNRRGQYVLARNGDCGAYELGNVRICTVSENIQEAGWTRREQRRSKMNWSKPGFKAARERRIALSDSASRGLRRRINKELKWERTLRKLARWEASMTKA